MYFPPAFFDISVHFTTHLIKEIKLLGPVLLHKMYAYERFNGILKSFIRNQAYLHQRINHALNTLVNQFIVESKDFDLI
jgi:hypothetical protein